MSKPWTHTIVTANYRDPERVDKCRLTATQIVTEDGRRYNRNNGKERGRKNAHMFDMLWHRKAQLDTLKPLPLEER